MLRRENGRGQGDGKQEYSAMTVDNDAAGAAAGASLSARPASPMALGMARYVSGRDGAFDNSTMDNSDSPASRRSSK